MDAASDLVDLTAAYKTHLAAERNCAPATIATYARDLTVLARLAGTRPADELTAADIRGFAARLHQKGLKPRSIARALSAWRGFFSWCQRRRGFEHNPATGIRAPKAGRGLPKAVSVDNAGMLLERRAAFPADPREIRDHAMFELFYSSGLRLSELIALNITPGGAGAGWVDARAGEVTVTGKGGKTRVVPVGSKALDALHAWLGIRAQLQKTDPRPLFLSSRGRRVSASLVQSRLRRWALRSGVPDHVHPHVLRHSFASHLLQSSGDLRAVQELLGHANISTTQIYTHLDFQQLAKAYDAAHPRAKRK